MTAGIDRYFHSGLPLLTTNNRFEFLIKALEVRSGDLKHYWMIVAGIQRTAGMIRALKRLLAQIDPAEARGELKPWLEEMRTLVDRPAFARFPAALLTMADTVQQHHCSASRPARACSAPSP